MSYEDMQQNTEQEMTRILNFYNLPINRKILLDAIDFASFKNLQNMEKKKKLDSTRFTQDEVNKKHALKIRKGQVGNYKEELTQKDINFLDKIIRKNLYIKKYK